MEQKNIKFVEYFIFPLIIGIIVGLSVSFLWQKFNTIKDENIFLFDTARATSDTLPLVSVSPIEIKLSWLKRANLKFGIYNSSNKTLKNGVLNIYFSKDIRVIGGESWFPTGRSETYCVLSSINPSTRLILLPVEIEVEVLENKVNEVNYIITGDDFKTSSKKMLIKIIH